MNQRECKGWRVHEGQDLKCADKIHKQLPVLKCFEFFEFMANCAVIPYSVVLMLSK